MSIRVYHVELAQAQADRALASLLGRSERSAPFERLDWLQLLASASLNAGRCFLAVASDATRIVALPLRETAFGYEQLGDWYSFFVRPVGDGDGDLLAALAGSLRRPLRLRPMPETDARAMAQALRAQGWLGAVSACDFNYHCAITSSSFEEWWSTRPGALRETVRRRSRDGRVAIQIASEFSAEAWSDYEAVYARSWKPAEGSPAFLRRFAQAEAQAGALRLGIARIDGVPVAAQLWTIEGGTAWIHKLAHDEAHKARSPGTLLSHAMFAHAIDADKVRRIDFGTGGDAYKRDWMDSVRTRYVLEFHRPSDLRSWPRLTRLAVRALAKRPLVLPGATG